MNSNLAPEILQNFTSNIELILAIHYNIIKRLLYAYKNGFIEKYIIFLYIVCKSE